MFRRFTASEQDYLVARKACIAHQRGRQQAGVVRGAAETGYLLIIVLVDADNERKSLSLSRQQADTSCRSLLGLCGSVCRSLASRRFRDLRERCRSCEGNAEQKQHHSQPERLSTGAIV